MDDHILKFAITHALYTIIKSETVAIISNIENQLPINLVFLETSFNFLSHESCERKTSALVKIKINVR